MQDFMTSPLWQSFNAFMLAGLLLGQVLLTQRVLRAQRKVLDANKRLLEIVNQMHDRLVEAGEVLDRAGKEIGQARKAALFWYTLWLQAVSKRS